MFASTSRFFYVQHELGSIYQVCTVAAHYLMPNCA